LSALQANTTGASNTAVGVNALATNTTASNNVAVGYQSLLLNTTGASNTAVGNASLKANTTGASNTAVGYQALDANTTAHSNTAIGTKSLSANTTGEENTALGEFALFTNTTASNNTAVGKAALKLNTTGALNTATGYQALGANTTGAHNTAVGSYALYQCTTGSANIAIGRTAAGGLTTGINNTFIGRDAGYVTTTGSYNVIIGQASRPDGAGSNYAMGIGYNLDCGGQYTTLGINTTDSRLNHGTTNWVTVSDERYKKDITDAVAGLSFINALQPRTFNYKAKGELPTTFRAYEEGSTEVFKDTATQHGFIAQEVKAAMDADSSIQDGFKMWSERTDGSQEVGDAALIPILVKAIQELSAKDVASQTLIASLAARLTALEA